AATVLFLAGIVTGLLAGAAGLVAFFTVPDTHTELAHQFMYWHLGFMVVSLLIFSALTGGGWRKWQTLPGARSRFFLWLGTLLLVVGAAFGGHIVYHGGTGIEADLMKPGLHEEHQRGHAEEQYPAQQEDHAGHEAFHERH